MNRFYNHIKHLVDNIDVVTSNEHRLGCKLILLDEPKHGAN